MKTKRCVLSPVDLSLASLICRVPAAEQRARRKQFFPCYRTASAWDFRRDKVRGRMVEGWETIQ